MNRTLDRNEIARLLSVSPRSLERWIARGCPNSRGRGGRLYFNEAEVRQWASANGLLESVLRTPAPQPPLGRAGAVAPHQGAT